MALLVVLLAGGGAFYLRHPTATMAGLDPRVSDAAPGDANRGVPERAPADAGPVVQAPGAPGKPSFDIVRVTPEGSTVIAGRATPGADVMVREGGRVLGTAKVDRNGEFVVVPAERLPPGGRELTLAARDSDGTETQSADSVIVIVPQPKVAQSERSAAEQRPDPPAQTERAAGSGAAGDGQAMAILVPRGEGAPRMLQQGAAGDRKETLALNTVDYDEKGEIRFSGSAKPSSPVQVYVDDKRAGAANADRSGQWTLTPPETVAPGVHRLRVDELGGDGRVQRRVELPFQRTTSSTEGLGPGHAVVQPGQNLWRIARASYGQGTRYTVIFLANRAQIKDPNRIYPGQVFAMPVSE